MILIGQLLKFTQFSFEVINTVLGAAAPFGRLTPRVVWLLRIEPVSFYFPFIPYFALKTFEGRLQSRDYGLRSLSMKRALLSSVCWVVIRMSHLEVGDLGGVCVVVLQVFGPIFVWVWRHGRRPAGRWGMRV